MNEAKVIELIPAKIKKQLKKCKQLRNELLELYTQIQNDEISDSKARQLIRVAEKLLLSALLELDYNSKMGKKKTIDFFEDEN